VHVLGRHGMRILALFFLLFSPRLRAQNATQEVATLIIIAGAPGEEEYGKAFSEWAALWDKAGAQSGAKTISIGLKAVEGTTDRDRLQKTLETEAKESANELWLVLIGHGTFDGKEAKFNLRGPDVSATEIAQWLKPFRRRLILINTASSSAPFLNKISGTNRVIVTTTRCSNENILHRFYQYMDKT